MRFVALCALMALACSNSPSSAPAPAASVGGSAEALRKLGQQDATAVEKCRDIVEACNADGGSGDSARCDGLAKHCDELEEQFESDRAELEQCLEEAAACEQTATDPAECEAARAACSPADREFRGRRDRTLQCASQAERCIGPGFGFGRRGGPMSDADAGAQICDDEAIDFVGCCHGKHRDRGDAGADDNAGNARRGGFFGGFGPPRDGRDHDDDDTDAGSPRRSRP